MILTQYYLDCLSQASYLVGDETSRQAVVVDPRRDVAEYLADAEAHGLRIVGVIDTHVHADFLAGHLELAEATGAWIGFGVPAKAEFPVRHLADGERIVLGEVVLEVWETPGHTPESISVLVYEHAGDEVPYGVLTGDALLIGDVGRPDLLASIGHTADELGRMLYASVRRLMTLPDPVRVLPAHGGGSASGPDLATDRWSTIGEQRTGNYACQPMDEIDFLALVTAEQPAAPDYFGYDALLNRHAHDVFDPAHHARPLDLAEALRLQDAGAVLVDARDPQEFAAKHLPGSLNVPADGRFAETAGTVVRPEEQIVVIAPQDREEEVARRLARIGFDHVAGYLREPGSAFRTAPERTVRVRRVTAPQLATALRGPLPPVLLDVRHRGELAEGAIVGAWHVPLAQLPHRLADLPRDRAVVTYCADGYRSSVAASLLRRAGVTDVSDLVGGYGAWAALARNPSPAPVEPRGTVSDRQADGDVLARLLHRQHRRRPTRVQVDTENDNTDGDVVDATGWDQRYATTDLVWSAGPNRTVTEEVGGRKVGTALDLGAGEGRNALWLAEQGWTVTAVDFSVVGLDKARASARQRGLQLTTVVADVTRYHPEQTYDLVLIAYLQLPWAELQDVLAAAVAALAPGGTVLLVAHDLINLTEGVGGPQDPAVLQTPDQVAAALTGLRIEKAGRVRRPVDIDGTTRHAIDTLVRACARHRSAPRRGKPPRRGPGERTRGSPELGHDGGDQRTRTCNEAGPQQAGQPSS